MDKKQTNKLIIIIIAVVVVALMGGILAGIAISSQFKSNTQDQALQSSGANPNALIPNKDDVVDFEAIDAEPVEEISVEDEDAMNPEDTKDVDDTTSSSSSTTKEADTKVETITDSGMPISEAEKLIKPAEVKPETTEAQVVAKGEKYEIIEDDISFTSALEECEERGGHMLWINDYDEYAQVVKFIYDNTADNCIFYLGGMRKKSGKEYYWIDSEKEKVDDTVLNNVSAWCAGAWAENEPSFIDNHDNDERYMAMYYNSGEGRWVWCDVVNDLPGNANTYIGRTAYICEYE